MQFDTIESKKLRGIFNNSKLVPGMANNVSERIKKIVDH